MNWSSGKTRDESEWWLRFQVLVAFDGMRARKMRFVGLKLQQFWDRAWNWGQGLFPNKWDFLSGQERISKHLTQKGKEWAAGRAVILCSFEQVRCLFQQTPAKVEAFPLVRLSWHSQVWAKLLFLALKAAEVREQPHLMSRNSLCTGKRMTQPQRARKDTFHLPPVGV